MAYDIKVGGVTMPAPKNDGGLVETYEAIWSTNTGRDDNGYLVGTLITTKQKVKIEWNALSWSDATRIKAAILNVGFTTLTFPSIDGTNHTIEGYFSTPSFSQYSWADGMRWATDISVDFIER